ncbi:hypothetical protein [Natronomonas marina]|jgi:hypothetical protein|uniref:hypothetical protein n=1 Tax=Natronomonas marina TaxID=2961939 RepID=UPI0020C996F9|nr:hypothetical protein [Natronomonas marina]
MRTITRNAVLVIVGLLVVLLALGALPSLIQTGDPYYVEATVVDGSGPAIAGENISERRFPYTFGAIAAAESGADPARSEPYYTGVVGFKEAFTHTPFSEFSEFETRNPAAVERADDSPVGDIAYLRANGTRYRLEIVRVPEASG